jgi:hypothetical protein
MLIFYCLDLSRSHRTVIQYDTAMDDANKNKIILNQLFHILPKKKPCRYIAGNLLMPAIVEIRSEI